MITAQVLWRVVLSTPGGANSQTVAPSAAAILITTEIDIEARHPAEMGPASEAGGVSTVGSTSSRGT
jgi:hypothetical protein